MGKRMAKAVLALAISIIAVGTICDSGRCEESLQSVSHEDSLSNSQYVDTVRETVLENWAKNQASLAAKRATTVSFSISKNGTVSQLSIKASSGNSHQDYAAIETIIASSFSPLPNDGPDAVSVEMQVGALHKK
jgi:TonB family protein